MLASAVALHEGFTFCPDETVFWKQSKGTENSYLYVTTNHVTENTLNVISGEMSDNEFLIIACKSFDGKITRNYPNITVKKIPEMLLEKCEFNKDNYDLNIVNPPVYEDEDNEEEDYDE